MFWFVFIFALLVYGICHIANMYREKAILSGENKIGLFEDSKCPFSRKCKNLAFLAFIVSFLTAFIVYYSEHLGDDWNFLTLNHASWESIHISMVLLWVIAISIFTYIHFEAFAAGLRKVLHIKVM